MLRKGDQVPHTDVVNASGESIGVHTLWQATPIVIYFYPADFTPG